MAQDNTSKEKRTWHESSHASLCLLGSYLQEQRFFRPLETRVHVRQKALKYTPVQKLEMRFVSVLAGAKAVAHTDFTLRADPALYRAFGRPCCAEQSVIADTLDAATEADLAAFRQALTDLFKRRVLARRHDFRQDLLVLDIDLSPLPASRHAEGSERGYMGRCRDVSGRKLVRVRAAHDQETVWEEIWPGNTIESLVLLQSVLEQAEQRLGLAGESPDVQARRSVPRFGSIAPPVSDRVITWLLERGYQVTGKFKSTRAACASERKGLRPGSRPPVLDVRCPRVAQRGAYVT